MTRYLMDSSLMNSSLGDFYSTMSKNLVGFDQLFSSLQNDYDQIQTSSFPPYNLIKLEENYYVLQMALAGYGPDEIEVIEENGSLSVNGRKDSKDENTQYLCKGIAMRNFKRSFPLAEHVKTEKVESKDGLLNIYLRHEIPEELQPKKIEITSL